MFVSHPEYEFPIPPALNRSGSQHWRIVELTLHAPWFLVSVEVANPDEPEECLRRTFCIAWDLDLAEMVRSVEPSRITGIVCLMPAWQSPSGQWWSREIKEVWIYRSENGKHVVLVDRSGQKFDCGLIPQDVGDVAMELIARVSPADQNGQPGRPRQPA